MAVMVVLFFLYLPHDYSCEDMPTHVLRLLNEISPSGIVVACSFASLT